MKQSVHYEYFVEIKETFKYTFNVVFSNSCRTTIRNNRKAYLEIPVKETRVFLIH